MNLAPNRWLATLAAFLVISLNIRTGAIAVMLLTLGLTATPTRAENLPDKAAQVAPAVAAVPPVTTEIQDCGTLSLGQAHRDEALTTRTALSLRALCMANAEPVFEPFEPLSLPTALVQRPDAGYDQWRARMDAATAKRRRGMILTAGGLLGGPLVAGLAFSASGESEGGARAGYYVSLAGLGVATWGVFQWINGHSEVGRLRDEGARAGYVSVSPVRGGAVGTLALSF